jgi:AAA family ATP:ADP antiporter
MPPILAVPRALSPNASRTARPKARSQAARAAVRLAARGRCAESEVQAGIRYWDGSRLSGGACVFVGGLPSPRGGLLSRPLAKRAQASKPVLSPERRLAFLAASWHFLTVAAMYILYPVRGAFLLETFGPSILPWVLMAGAAATGAASWAYARAAVLPRKKFISGALGVSAAGLAGWWALSAWARSTPGLPFAFYIWTDVFSITAVTLFWSYANDRFKGDAARRWFGFLAAAGALGGMAGSAAARLLVGRIGAVHLLLVGAAAIAAVLWVFHRMERLPDPASSASGPAPEAASGPAEAARAVWKSPLLLAMAGLVFFERFVPDLSNFVFSFMAQAALPGTQALVGFMAAFGFWQNLLSLACGAVLTKWILDKAGVGGALLGAPLANLVGSIAFALFPSLAAATAYNGIEGWQRYSWFKAAKETAYSSAGKGVIYQVKPYIEMFVYRFARGLAGLALLLLTGKDFLGLGPAEVAWAAVPFALAWALCAWKLGREYRREERDRALGLEKIGHNGIFPVFQADGPLEVFPRRGCAGAL